LIDVFIPGQPKAQGSKRHVGHGVMIESCKELPSWRESIRSALALDNGQPIERFEGAVVCTLEFILHRPGSAPKRKATPPAMKKPDLDKLTRAAFDAVASAGVIQNDARIVATLVWKRLAERGETEGLRLRLIDYKDKSASFFSDDIARLSR
jgi:crossover junction endodeoxyribonuclease RusA